MMDIDIEHLISEAKNAMKRAYAPYSGFRVGASVVFSNGIIYSGANIENISYGLTICAERVAVFKGVYEQAGKIIALAIAVEKDIIPYPCGACRQVLSEFGNSFPVYLISGSGKREEFLFDELFPHTFEFNLKK